MSEVLLSPSQLVSSTQLVRNLSKYLDFALRKPLFVQRGDEIQVVIISLDEYTKLLEKVKE